MPFLRDVWAGRPLPFVWPWLLLFWGVFAWSFREEGWIVREARKNIASAGNSPDAGSIRVIVFGMQTAWLVAVALSWVRACRVPRSLDVPVFLAGVALIVAGSLMRRHCWKMLGGSFTGDVRASADQQIVTRGAYAWLRHPSYTAGIILWLGMGLAMGSWLATLLLLTASFATYGYRIAVEERTLLAVIGEPYRVFCETRKRLIPFVY